LLEEADKNDDTYASFLFNIMSYEQQRREEKKIERHLKWATFPYHKTLDQFYLNEQESISKKQFNQLQELLWIEQLYNLIDRKSTRLNSSHVSISYAVFFLKK